MLLVYPNVSMAVTPQMGLLSLGSSLVTKEIDVKISDISFTAHSAMQKKIIDDYLNYKPDFVGISCRTMEYPFVSELCKTLRNLKNKKPWIVIGGPHMTFASRDLISLCDWGVIGEGEKIISEIALAISEGRIDDIYGFNNITYERDGKIVKNSLSPLLDMNTLPVPRWDLFDERHYSNHFALTIKPGSKVACSFEGSRGCPFVCTYCSNEALMNIYKGKGRWRREKSLAKLKTEILSFKDQYGLNLIYYIDEVIMTSDQRAADYKATFKDLKVPFVFMDRPEFVTEERVNALKESGAYSASIGIESGDNEYRMKMLKRRMDNKKIIKAYQILKENNIKTHSFIMFGLPEQDEKSMHKSYDLIKKIQPESAQATTFYPLPGTKLEEYSAKMGYWDGGVYPTTYYSDTYLRYTDDLKKSIELYCNLVNSMVWKNGLINKFLEFFSIRSLAFSRLVSKWVILQDSLKSRGFAGTLRKVIAKLKSL